MFSEIQTRGRDCVFLEKSRTPLSRTAKIRRICSVQRVIRDKRSGCGEGGNFEFPEVHMGRRGIQTIGVQDSGV